MARMIPQPLTLKAQSIICNSRSFVASRFINIRHQSKKPQLSESDRSDTSESESDIRLRRKLEEEVEAIIARRAAPDWILFAPGSSYWVPPMAKTTTTTTETCFSPVRGWPSFSYFVEVGIPNTQFSSHRLSIHRHVLPIKEILALGIENPNLNLISFFEGSLRKRWKQSLQEGWLLIGHCSFSSHHIGPSNSEDGNDDGGILPREVNNSPEKVCSTTDDEESGLHSADKISGVLPNMVENSPAKVTPKTDDE